MMQTKKDPTYAGKIFRKVIKEGRYAKGTREIVGFHDRIFLTTNFWKKKSGANIEMVSKLFEAIMQGDNSFCWGPYQSSYYTFLKDAIPVAASQFISDGPNTRRAVITFPEGHCFTSIQVLVRPGTLIDPTHRSTVIVNMRSCNAIANFPHDLFLAFLIHKQILSLGFGDAMFGINMGEMIVNIGSLHHFII